MPKKKVPINPPTSTKYHSIASFFGPNRFAALAEDDHEAKQDDSEEHVPAATASKQDDTMDESEWTLVTGKRPRSQASIMTSTGSSHHHPRQRSRVDSPQSASSNDQTPPSPTVPTAAPSPMSESAASLSLLTEDEQLEIALRLSAEEAAAAKAKFDEEWPALPSFSTLAPSAPPSGKGKGRMFVVAAPDVTSSAAPPASASSAAPDPAATSSGAPSPSIAASQMTEDEQVQLAIQLSAQEAAAPKTKLEDDECVPLPSIPTATTSSAAPPASISSAALDEGEESLDFVSSDEDLAEDDVQAAVAVQMDKFGIPIWSKAKSMSFVVAMVTPSVSGTNPNHVSVLFFSNRSEPAAYVSGHFAGDGIHNRTTALFGVVCKSSSTLELLALLRMMQVPAAQVIFIAPTKLSRLGGGRLGIVEWQIIDSNVHRVWMSFGLPSSLIFDLDWPKAEIFFGDVGQKNERVRFLLFVLGMIAADGSVIVRRYSEESNPNCYFTAVEICARDRKVLDMILVKWIAIGGRDVKITQIRPRLHRLYISCSSYDKNLALLKEGMTALTEFCDDVPPKMAKLQCFLQNKVQPICLMSPEYNRMDFTSYVPDHSNGVLRVLAQDFYYLDVFAVNGFLKVLEMPLITSIFDVDLEKVLIGLKRVAQTCDDDATSASGPQKLLAGYLKLLQMRVVDGLTLKNKKKAGFPCVAPGCGKRFNDKQSLGNHARREHNAPKLKCDQEFCFFEANDTSEIHHHKKRVHKKSKKRPHKCFYTNCQTYFHHPHPENHPADYQEHALQSHDTELAYPCQHPGCDLVLASEQDLKSHSRIHKSKKPFQCLYCDALFASQYARGDHMRDKHNNKFVNGKWTCPDPDCNDDYASNSLSSVIRHNNTTHRGILYRCLHAGCIKRYTSPQNLANHVVIHQEGKLACPMCGKKVIDMKNHLHKFHHLSGDALKEMQKLLKKK